MFLSPITYVPHHLVSTSYAFIHMNKHTLFWSSQFIPICNSVAILLLNTVNVFPSHAVVIRCLDNCILTYFCPNSVAHSKTALWPTSWETLQKIIECFVVKFKSIVFHVQHFEVHLTHNYTNLSFPLAYKVILVIVSVINSFWSIVTSISILNRMNNWTTLLSKNGESVTWSGWSQSAPESWTSSGQSTRTDRAKYPVASLSMKSLSPVSCAALVLLISCFSIVLLWGTLQCPP